MRARRPGRVRRFLLLAHRASTSPDFRLEDLPGAGRLDLVCRTVAAAFVLSHGIRRDVRLDLLLQGPPDPPRAVRLEGSGLQRLNPDERSTAALLQKALGVRPTGSYWQPSTPGISVAKTDLAGLVGDAPVVLLEEGGEPIERAAPGSPADAVYVLGDDRGFTEGETGWLRERAALRVSVSPKSLHADHCVVLLHRALDARDAGT